MKKRLFGILAICFLFTALYAGGFEQFKQEMWGTPSWEDAKSKIIAYLSTTDNVEEIRELQDIWLDVEPDSCRAYFSRKAKDNPSDPKSLYLDLRIWEDENEQLNGAYDLCQRFPDFYWGYRLFMMAFFPYFMYATEEFQEPDRNLQAGAALMDEAIKRFPNDDYFLLFQVYRNSGRDNLEQAISYLSKIKNRSILTAHLERIRFVLKSTMNTKLYNDLVPEIIGYAINQGQIAQSDSLEQYAQSYIAMLYTERNLQGMRELLAKHPSLMEEWNYVDLYLRLLAVNGLWAELSREILDKGQQGVLDSKQINIYIDEWKFDLNHKPEWEALQKLANKPPNQ